MPRLTETKGKPVPEAEDKIIEIPQDKQEIPETPAETKDVPATPQEKKEVPVIPEPKALDKEMPSEVNEENCVTIGGNKIEIKPTKLKYFRNKTASIYNVLKLVPLTEFLTYDKGVFDATRDPDQILFDFLIAVFDDSAFVRDNYDNMTAGDVDRILKIFGRLNGIDEKEEAARKNREAQAKR